jgi:hypothetical protein
LTFSCGCGVLDELPLHLSPGAVFLFIPLYSLLTDYCSPSFLAPHHAIEFELAVRFRGSATWRQICAELKCGGCYTTMNIPLGYMPDNEAVELGEEFVRRLGEVDMSRTKKWLVRTLQQKCTPFSFRQYRRGHNHKGASTKPQKSSVPVEPCCQDV